MEPAAIPSALPRAEYAALKGVNRSTITRWAQADRLVLDDDGNVLVAESEARLAATADPSKIGVTRRHAEERGAEVRDLFAAPPAAAPGPGRQPKGEHYSDRIRESARHEAAKAEKAEIELARLKGELVDVIGVQQAMTGFGAQAYQERKRIDREIYLRLAAEADPDKVLALLADATERWATAVADQAAAMAAAATSTRQ